MIYIHIRAVLAACSAAYCAACDAACCAACGAAWCCLDVALPLTFMHTGEVLNRVGRLQDCREPRDRIFALLSIVLEVFPCDFIDDEKSLRLVIHGVCVVETALNLFRNIGIQVSPSILLGHSVTIQDLPQPPQTPPMTTTRSY